MVAQKASKEQEAVQILEQDGCFYVSTSRRGWYAVSLGNESEPNACECEHFRFRLAGTKQRCKHLEALRLHLSCPTCQGSGIKETERLNPFNMRLYPDSYACPGCLGEGTREAWLDLEGLRQPEPVDVEPAAVADGWAELSEAERLAVFA